MTIITDPNLIGNLFVGGVDTHADVHVVAVIDHLGREIGHTSFGTTAAEYIDLQEWLASHGTVTMVGVEGTGAYGAGLTRSLTANNIRVVEVGRPDRKQRRFQGKSDPLDAYAAARAALSGRASGTPKTRDGNVEMIRVLRIARSSAVKGRAVAITQLKSVIQTAPDGLHDELRDLNGAALINRCVGLRPSRGDAPVPTPQTKRKRPGQLSGIYAATKQTLVTLAKRVQYLSEEIKDVEDDLDCLVAETSPTLIEMFGVGTDVASQLLITVGDNPDRLTSSAAFAHLCGTAPIPASSGRTQNRHRLNRGGDRQANAAIYTIAMTRLRHEQRTQNRRDTLRSQGKTSKDILRILKRAIAREIYQAIKTDLIKPKNKT